MSAGNETLVAKVKRVFGIEIRSTWDGGYDDADRLRSFFLEQAVPIVQAEVEARIRLATAMDAMTSAKTSQEVAAVQRTQQAAERELVKAVRNLGDVKDCIVTLFGRGSHEGYVEFMDEAARRAQRQLVPA